MKSNFGLSEKKERWLSFSTKNPALMFKGKIR